MKNFFLILISFYFLFSAELFSNEAQLLSPNFWISDNPDDSCKMTMYFNEGEDATKIVLNCDGEEVILNLNFPVILGYADPEPASGSTFVLENQNLNYLTNPDFKLKVHMAYLGNGDLKVEIKAENFNWKEYFKVDFLNEIACPKGTECVDYAIGNNKISELLKFLEENPQYPSYLQELVNKIVENKDKSLEMAKIASIFIKNWLHTVVNVNKFYSSGLVNIRLVGGHCRVDECCLVKCFRERDCRTYCWTKCHILITDP